jgi:hypothetical protein
MAGSDPLLVVLDEHPVGAGAPRLDPAVSLQRSQHAGSLGHARHHKALRCQSRGNVHRRQAGHPCPAASVTTRRRLVLVLCGGAGQAHRRVMTTFSNLIPVLPDSAMPAADPMLRLAMAAYLARFKDDMLRPAFSWLSGKGGPGLASRPP